MRLTFDSLVERAKVAEVSGFTGMAIMDHLAPPMALDQPMYEAVVTATWLASRTERLKVGHLVLCDALRHPALLARQAVSIDHASGGRFELGLGWGSVPEELTTFGIADPSPATRVRRMAETLAVMKALWSGEPVDFTGEFFAIRAGLQRPVPLDRIPIVIGGAGPRTLELVAAHADWWNLPINALTQFDELRPRAGKARVSLQLMVSFIGSERTRHETAETARRRFGHMGEGLLVGNANELLDRLGTLTERGVERFYIWFSDFAAPETLAAFGAEVVTALGSAGH